MGSTAQQNEAVLRFGLRGRAVKEVLVRWPGGILEHLDVPTTGHIHVLRHPPASKVPNLKVLKPEATDEGWVLKAIVRGKSLWVWAFDLDGDGNFETVRKPGSKASAEATVAHTDGGEARVRVKRKGGSVLREGVWRLSARD